ncbi:hypothetical protein [Halomonas sp. CSM-2]|uniref:hypothetical protein n=1 Tax=Halomonas sp. CSM-2 TaxID=1975722 RepID=UPI000A28C54A|nr:hypothetical protein [Halomonas sp. CSM-2]
MTTYSDETLEQYADRFVQLRLARHGVNLAQYLANPVQFERLALEPEPLLPAQQAAVLRIWQRWDTGLAEQQAVEKESTVPDWDWRDLLERWSTETEQAERAVARMQQRNGAYVEPLHHNRHNARNRSANFAKRGA